MQFLYVRLRTEPDDIRLVSIELKTAGGTYTTELRQLSSATSVSTEYPRRFCCNFARCCIAGFVIKAAENNCRNGRPRVAISTFLVYYFKLIFCCFILHVRSNCSRALY